MYKSRVIAYDGVKLFTRKHVLDPSKSTLIMARILPQ